MSKTAIKRLGAGQADLIQIPLTNCAKRIIFKIAMTPFTHRDRQAGRKAMEKALSPMQKAYRKFLAGRPPATPKNTPLGAVTLATEQRKRLVAILEGEKGLKGARITSMAVVIRFANPKPNALADTIPVIEGKEGQAVATLEMYGEKVRREFFIVGLEFAIQEGNEKRLFAYPIERTPEGEAALLWSCQRQMSEELRKGSN